MQTQKQAIENLNYWNDSRVRASMMTPAYKVLSTNKNTTRVQLDEFLLESLIFEDEILPEDHDGIFELATKYEVCEFCRGSGSVVNPSIDAGGLSFEDFDEDPDFAEDYLSDRYNQPCPTCKGRRVVPCVEFSDENIREAIEGFIRNQREHAREMANAMRYGY